MDFWHGFWLITGIHLLAAVSPGPDFVLVSQQTLAHGRGTGLLSVPRVNSGFRRAGHWIDRVLGTAMAVLGVKVMTG
ncbi:hypothetical protein ACLD9W_04010 [Neisseria sp. WLZKY-1]|jgi:transporter, lysE family|uniref:hypothetical protein n=1 Tax=Neisseria sp. WLZKY-1 TaxID=3390377 RepID=UPI00397E20F8